MPRSRMCVNLHVQDGVSCSNGNVCDGEETCRGGQCTGTPLNCDDGDHCTTDGCDRVRGCTHVEIAPTQPSGVICAAGNVRDVLALPPQPVCRGHCPGALGGILTRVEHRLTSAEGAGKGCRRRLRKAAAAAGALRRLVDRLVARGKVTPPERSVALQREAQRLADLAAKLAGSRFCGR